VRGYKTLLVLLCGECICSLHISANLFGLVVRYVCVCIQDWYWYSLISYCISNGAYTGCDPPDVGLPLNQQPHSDDNEPAATSMEPADTESGQDLLAYDNDIQVCDNDEAVKSSVMTSFVENGFVDNLSDATTDEESILQLDGPIDKYPRKQQSNAAQSTDKSTVPVSVNATSVPDGITQVVLGGSAAAVENQEVNGACQVPPADTETAVNYAIQSVSPPVSEETASLLASANVHPFTDSCTQEHGRDDSAVVELGCETDVDTVARHIQDNLTSADVCHEVPVAGAEMTVSCAHHSVSPPAALPSISVDPPTDSCMQEHEQDSGVVSAVVELASETDVDETAAVQLRSCDCVVPVADAVVDENLIIHYTSPPVSVIPTSSLMSASVSAFTDSHICGQDNDVVVETDVDETGAMQLRAADGDDCVVPVADAVLDEKCMLHSISPPVSVVPKSSLTSADVCAFTDRRIHEQGNDVVVETDVDETAARQAQDLLTFADSGPQCLDVSYALSSEAAVTKQSIESHVLHCDVHYEARSETSNGDCLPDSLRLNMDPLVLSIMNSVKRSLDEHHASGNNSETARNSRDDLVFTCSEKSSSFDQLSTLSVANGGQPAECCGETISTRTHHNNDGSSNVDNVAAESVADINPAANTNTAELSTVQSSMLNANPAVTMYRCSNREVFTASVNIELRQKIIRQMEVCIHNTDKFKYC